MTLSGVTDIKSGLCMCVFVCVNGCHVVSLMEAIYGGL